ncbi:MAG: hypothetical protein M3R58_16275 [Pseudomonadota bacterium]|nr:hypothetical protein [Pseudomonadota bacterium]
MNAITKVKRGTNTMRRIAQATVLALLVVSQPQAQTGSPPRAQVLAVDGTIASLRDVKGNVLVSNESGLATGNEALRLLPSTRVITTANAGVVIAFDDGCDVKLKENERFEVEKGKPCALLLAQPYAIVVAAAGATIIPGIIVGAFGAAALGSLIDARNTTTASPS